MHSNPRLVAEAFFMSCRSRTKVPISFEYMAGSSPWALKNATICAFQSALFECLHGTAINGVFAGRKAPLSGIDWQDMTKINRVINKCFALGQSERKGSFIIMMSIPIPALD